MGGVSWPTTGNANHSDTTSNTHLAPKMLLEIGVVIALFHSGVHLVDTTKEVVAPILRALPFSIIMPNAL